MTFDGLRPADADCEAIILADSITQYSLLILSHTNHTGRLNNSILITHTVSHYGIGIPYTKLYSPYEPRT